MSEATSQLRTVAASKFKRKDTKGHTISNVILALLHGRQHDLLKKLILDSIAEIKATFFEGKDIIEITSLVNAIEGMPHYYQMTVFFILLNVEMSLKTKVMELEVAHNKKKLARFMHDLRNHLIIPFFTNETCTIWNFVNRCEEFYVLA